MGKLFPVLFFVHLIFSVTANCGKQKKINSIVYLNYIGTSFNMVCIKILFNIENLLLLYQVYIIYKALLKAKLL